MATAERDYYELLGVPRGADDAEIKSAFRRRARELHPDVSDAADAQERFREVAEAYEVLSNPRTRELYDRYGLAGLRQGGFRPTHVDLGNLSDLFSAFFGDDLFARSSRRRPARGGDLAAEVEIELREAAAGVARSVEFDVAVTCEVCEGDGAEPGTQPVACPTCGGAGMLQQVSRSLFGEYVRTHPCPRCAGSGRVVETPCTACDGAGRRVESRSVDVEIPPGIHDGQQIRLRGRGHAGAPGGLPGDVYVQVHVRPDDVLVRDGDDVLTPVTLTMVQAALGATVTVPTLDGEQEVELPAGTQGGDVVVLEGRGMPRLQGFRRGDQRLVVEVLVPRRLTEEQRRLLHELDRALGDEAYHPDEGFFDRLKSAFR